MSSEVAEMRIQLNKVDKHLEHKNKHIQDLQKEKKEMFDKCLKSD